MLDEARSRGRLRFALDGLRARAPVYGPPPGQCEQAYEDRYGSSAAYHPQAKFPSTDSDTGNFP